LQLDKSRSGLRTLGAETAVDVELDRKHYEQQNPDRVSQNKEPSKNILLHLCKIIAPASPPPSSSSEITPTPARSTDSNLNQVSAQKLPEIPKTPETPRLVTPLASPIKRVNV
jgi:hypothetical protein